MTDIDNTEQDTKQNVARNITRKMISMTNSSQSTDAIVAGVIEALAGEHRTLQQSYWRVMFKVMETYKDMPHDLRNQASVEACKEIAERGHYFPYV